jgi:hypothetical protein
VALPNTVRVSNKAALASREMMDGVLPYPEPSGVKGSTTGGLQIDIGLDVRLKQPFTLRG